MPIYSYRCPYCGTQRDEYRKVDDRDNAPFCMCEQNMHGILPMSRVVTAPYIAPDIQPYQSMIDGSWITSRSKHAEHLKQHGCIEIGNETKHLPKKQEIDVSPESKAKRKQTIIDKVNAL